MPLLKKTDRFFPSAIPLLVGVITFIVTVCISELLLFYELKSVEEQIKIGELSFANALRARVDLDFNMVLHLSSGLASYLVVRNSHLNDEEIKEVLENLYQTEESYHIRNFGIAVGYILRYVYPEDGNQGAVGLDYRDLPDQWPDVKRAVNTKSGLLVGPIKLKQGGIGLIYRKPIYVGNSYWGMLSTSVDFGSFVEEAFTVLQGGNFRFSVWDNQNNTLLWGDGAIFKDPDAVKLVADVPGGQWTYAVQEKYHPRYPGLLGLYRIVGWVAALLLGVGVFWMLHQRVELKRMSMFDALTGLPNRRLFSDRLLQVFNRLQRNQDIHCFVLFVDLNGFKEVNDRHGHRVGDRLLSVVAKRITSVLRASDTASRWGGDEFVLLLEAIEPAHVTQLISRLRKVIAEPLDVVGNQINVSASIGMASYPEDGQDSEALLRLADERMYSDKLAQKK